MKEKRWRRNKEQTRFLFLVPYYLLHHFPPTLGTVKDDRTMKLKSDGELHGEKFAHRRRNRLLLQTVKTDLANTKLRIRREPRTKPLFNDF